MEEKKKRIFRNCSVPTCSTYAQEGRGFYVIQKDNLNSKRQSWIGVCGLTFSKSKVQRICWKHFKPKDFVKEFDPLATMEEIIKTIGLGMLKKNFAGSRKKYSRPNIFSM